MAVYKRFRLKKFPKKVGPRNLKSFMHFYNLNNKRLERIITQGPATDPSVEKDMRDYEAAVFEDFNKYFTPENMITLSKGTKGPMAGIYNKLKEARNTTTLKTAQQAEAVKELSRDILDKPAYRDVTMGAQQQPAQQQLAQQQPAQQQVGPRQPLDVIGEQIGNIIREIPSGGAQQPATRTADGLTQSLAAQLQRREQPKKKGGVKFTRGQQQRISPETMEAATTAGGELLGSGMQAYRQGAPPVERFGAGQPQSPALAAYDELINRIRPERTTAQRAAAAFAPYGTQTGATLGGLAGTALGGPGLGSAIGGGVGALAGLGLEAALSRAGKPDPELSALGKLIGGAPAGWLRSGQRGLAGLISGEDPRSSLRTGFGLFRGRGPTGRMSGLRRSIGGGLRGVGDWLSQPGRAQQIRGALATGEAAYGLGEELGINRAIRSLGERLGILSPQVGVSGQYYPGGSLAAQSINPVIQQFAPVLQQQASKFMGREIPAEMVTRGLTQEMLGTMVPQLAKQELKKSETRSRRQALEQRKQALSADASIQAAINQLKGQQQQETFGRNIRQQELQGREMVERSRMQAARNQLSKLEALSGQQVQLQMPIERVAQQPGVPEALMATGGMVQQAITPYVQSQITQALNQPSSSGPIQVNPTTRPPLTTSDYSLSVT